MKRALILVSAMAIAVTTAPAYAHDGKGPRGAKVEFSDFDADGNGEVTLAEIQAHHAARFAEVDANGDGLLSAEEIAAQGVEAKNEKRKARFVERMMKRVDANEDGQVSLEEMAAMRGGPEKMIERLDKDENGSISEEEFSDARWMRGGRGKGHGKGHGRG